MRQEQRIVHLRVRQLVEERNLSDLELAHLSGVDARVIRRMWNEQEAGRVFRASGAARTHSATLLHVWSTSNAMTFTRFQSSYGIRIFRPL